MLREVLATALLRAGQMVGRSLMAADLEASAMVFAPHPDDEVLGCGGTIQLMRAAGASVAVVIMTDGRASHAGLIPARDLVSIRRAESEQAAIQLGLSPADYVHLDFEDHRLDEVESAASDRVLQLLESFNPAQVFVPHRRDGLSDHVATFEIVCAALARRGKPVTIFEYPVWLWHRWPWTGSSGALGSWRALPRLVRDVASVAFGCRAFVDVKAVLPRKALALAAYQSQTERRAGFAKWPVLRDVAGGAFLSRLLSGREIFAKTRWTPGSRTQGRCSRPVAD